ncbi:protein translocase subunit SecDF [Mucilaginibacter paludis]|uniref:Multifunctional fusion protein n=1 Tax=Mucilaginibacter paludis DSM 18603 TaxID=714943 RepID=H1YH85_9SPHI|nr:protein translocase subunit SecDF [Mucilaginibacter paludis]EHQ24587.1 protein-export membrane protein SecD [Mucilaginibacter paludis DSM 18603]
MQGKGIIKFFAILLAVVCLYQLSFTFVAQKVERDAKDYAKGNLLKERSYLDSMATQPVYPLLKHTYQYCKDKEIALGLDLKGGMDVTMQISLVELVKSLSNNNPDVALNQALANASVIAKTSTADYITLFVQEYEKLAPNAKLAAIFSTKENQDHIKFNASNNEVKSFLQDQAKVAITQAKTVLTTRIDQFGVTQPNIQLQQGNRILIEMPGVFDKERVDKLLQGSANLEFYETFDNAEFYQVLINVDKILAAKAKINKTDTTAAQKVAATAETKKDSTKADLSLLNKVQKNAGKDSTSALGKKNQLNQNPLFAVMQLNTRQGENGQPQLGPGPVVGYSAQKDTAKVNAYLNSADAKSVIPHNVKLLWGVKPIEKTKIFELYAIKLSGAENGPVLAGDVISDARPSNDQKGNPEVVMVMNSDGATKWRRVTAVAAAKEPKKAIAIVLDNNVYSAPTVQNEIAGGISSISGNFSIEDTKDLANVLKSGRLKAPAHIIGEEIVGASLGQEAISAGLTSSLVGLLVVLIFMVAYYNRAGTVACIAVVINVFFLMGVLASLNAVLTLEGIAGIVLTLGIAVDANVLIYERVREELAHGKSLRIAVTDGFTHALSSILDSNISTFLTGFILYIFGSGPIRGFATTLMIGIVTSLFCSLLISRLIFEWMLKKDIQIKFSNPWSSHTFKNAHFAFVKNRFKFYIFSGVFILAGLVSMFTQGFNYGVDFKGGRTYIVRYDQPVSSESVREAVVLTLNKETIVKTFGTSGNQVSITTTYLIDDNSNEAGTKVQEQLKTGLAKVPGKYQIMSQQTVGPTIASDLKSSAIYAVLFAILIISVYILIRFRKWQFSLGAMIATAHDALLVLSFFSLFKDVLPFSLDIDQKFIAAILTVIGYSINDTVVVFDRIREFLELHHAKTDKPEEVINQAINSTLSRTIITALTVIFVLVVLFIFGGDVIRGFSFALLIGVTFGTYSSICVATPVIVDFGKKDLR